jgi:type III secretion system low calcium response chaperone LcrH/SycD
METKTIPTAASEDELIDACIEKFCKEINWPEPPPSPLRTKPPIDEVKIEFKKIIKHIFFNRDLQERTYRGFVLIQENLPSMTTENRSELRLAAAVIFNYAVMNMSEHKDLLHLVMEEDAENMTINTEKIRKATEGDQHGFLVSLSDELGISESSLNNFYQVGYQFFQQDKYEEARCVFQFLASLNPCSHELWIALGMSHQKLSDWFSAVYSYSMASLMNPSNPISYIHSAECFIASKDKKNAEGSLSLAEYFLTDVNREAFLPIIVDLRQKT